MHTYKITLTTHDGKRITDEIKATSIFDAKSVILSRYPGATIWNVTKV